MNTQQNAKGAENMKMIRYKVFGRPYPQTTTVDVRGISPPNVYSYADEVLRNRFGDDFVRVNHAGRTVTLRGLDQ